MGASFDAGEASNFSDWRALRIHRREVASLWKASISKISRKRSFASQERHVDFLVAVRDRRIDVDVRCVPAPAEGSAKVRGHRARTAADEDASRPRNDDGARLGRAAIRSPHPTDCAQRSSIDPLPLMVVATGA